MSGIFTESFSEWITRQLIGGRVPTSEESQKWVIDHMRPEMVERLREIGAVRIPDRPRLTLIRGGKEGAE